MIEESKLEQTGGFGDAESEPAVGFAGGGIAAGMIVREDECVGAVEDGRAENFARVSEAFIQRTEGNFFDAEEVEFCIEQDDPEGFLAELAHFSTEQIINELWLVERRACESFASEACGEAEGCCELHGFRRADAFDFRKFGDARTGELAEAAESHEDLPCDVHGICAGESGAKEDGDEFTVAQ